MADHEGRHRAKRSRLGGVAVFLVVAFSGYLLMTNVRVNHSTVVTSDTAELVEQRVKQVDKLQNSVKSLSSQINTLNKIANNDSRAGANHLEDAGPGTALPAVEGPGISVTLNDSPLWQHMVNDSGTTANVNDYVIHQQDIESVINALWRGGAEAMAIQGQRVVYNSAIICKGNVLMLQGKQYSPPYTVSAIGPAGQMRQALDDSAAIATYKQYVDAFGLGWKVEDKDNLKFPAAVLLQTLKYANAGKTDNKTDSKTDDRTDNNPDNKGTGEAREESIGRSRK